MTIIEGKRMNNKVIHYCWFGKNPKPKLILKCIESWKKFCPDYDIKEWNEDNFDVTCCDYVREAYEAKKWAFVSDYCRFYVLYHYGGVYLDTDVELLKSLDELNGTFVGFENNNRVNSGLIRGAVSGDLICKLMLDSYARSSFVNKDGSLNILTVCDRETEILCSHGMKRDNTLQIIEGTTIYPTEYFNPMDMDTGKLHITDNTVSIHHYAASWISRNDRMRGKIAKWFYRVFGTDKANRIRKLLGRKG